MLLSGVTMAAEEDAAATTTTTRRLRVRPPKIPEVLLQIDEEDTNKRKSEVILESLYLQKNCKDPIHTQLETIFEDPRPSKLQQRQASQDAALLMANRKLKRYLAFSSHYQPPRSKLKQRKQCAQRFQRITKVCVPTGNVISDDELFAALSCLEEETAAPGQCQERGLLDPSNTSATNLVEGMISVHNSLNGGFESPLLLPNQTHKETASAYSLSLEEEGKKPRCDMIPQVNGVSPSSSLTSSSTHQSSPPKMSAREKRLKRRSGVVLPQSSSSPPSLHGDAEASTNSHSPKSPCPRVAGRPRGARQSRSPQTVEHPTSSKDAQLKLGSKRSPDVAPATTVKKHRMPKTPQDPTKDPAHTPQRGRGRGKDKRRRSANLKPSLTLTNDSPSDSAFPASRIPRLLSTLPSPPKDQPHTLLNSPATCVVPAGVEGGGGGGSLSPSFSVRVAAPSPHVSPAQPSPPSKPKKVRRRSARLSIGSDVIEGLRGLQNGDSSVPLGSVWAAFSPMEKTSRRAVDSSESDGLVLPPNSTDTAKKKGQSKGRRRSNLYSHLEMMDSLGEAAVTATTESTSAVPDCSTRPVSASPQSLHSPTVQDSLTPLHNSTTTGTLNNEPMPIVGTPCSCSPPLSPGMQQGVSDKEMVFTTTPSPGNAVPPGHPQAVTEGAKEVGCHVIEEEGGVVCSATPCSGSEDSASPCSPFTGANIATYDILEVCPDLSPPSLTPSSCPMVSSDPASVLASPQTQPALVFTPSKILMALMLTPAQTPSPTLTPSMTMAAPSLMPSTTLPISSLTPTHTPSFPTLTPSMTMPAPSFTPSTTLPVPTLTPAQMPASPAVSPPQTMPSSPITPSQAIPIAPITPSQAAMPSSAITPSQATPVPALTPSQATPAPALTRSQALLGPALTSSQARLTQGTSPGHSSTSSEGDSDSPILQGILANHTLIQEGRVCCPPPLLS